MGGGSQSGGDAEGDILENIENVFGSDFADSITGDEFGNVLNGQAGDDNLFGGAGDDRLIGGAGADFLFGGFGNDTATGGTGGDLFGFSIGSGRDVITDFELGIDQILLDTALWALDARVVSVADLFNPALGYLRLNQTNGNLRLDFGVDDLVIRGGVDFLSDPAGLDMLVASIIADDFMLA